MFHKPLAGVTMALVAATTIAACSKGSSTTTSAPAPAATPSGNTAAARPSNGLPSSVTPAMIAQGDSIYHARGCRNCHGMDGKGGPRAPDLTDAQFLHVNGTLDAYVKIITDGVPVEAIKDKSRTAAMRPRGGPPTPLTDDQIKAVAAYVFTLKK